MVERTAAARIEKFLADHPGAPLTVAVGYGSPNGLAWLARRTKDRKVRLFIGNCQPKFFINEEWVGIEETAQAAEIPAPTALDLAG